MSEALINALSEHGPWAIMVFFLLYRDLQKDAATRSILEKNTQILIELTTMLKERLPRGG